MDTRSDAVEQALRRFSTSRARPLLITREVLRGQSRGAGRARFAGAIATAMLMIPLVAGAVAPRIGVALADAPVVGTLLRESGLEAVGDRLSGINETATQQGVLVTLVAGYADSARTAFVLRVSPSARIDLGAVALLDQFGRSYELRSSVADVASGEQVLLFAPLQWPASMTGARLSLRTSALTLEGNQRVTGDWKLSAVLVSASRSTIQPPDAAAMGDVAIRFREVSIAPGTLIIDADVSDPSGALTAPPSSVEGPVKPEPRLAANLRAGDGKQLPASMLHVEREGSSVRLTIIWFARLQGEYVLVLNMPGRGEMTRTLRVP